MTQPPDGYPPPPDPGRHHPTPAWDQPTQPGRPVSPTPPAQPTQPWAGPPAAKSDPYGPPGSAPPYGPPPAGLPPPSAGPPRRRRRALLIGAVALAGVLVLSAVGGVGAWLLTRDPDRNGAESAAAAVQSFLQAVYRDLDPAAAAATVCSEARDEDSLATKIGEIRAYEQTALNPAFSWSDPSVVNESGELMILAVTVTMTTDDEKTAQQTLHVSVLDKDPNGWWVCDLETVQEPGAEGASPGPSESPGG